MRIIVSTANLNANAHRMINLKTNTDFTQAQRDGLLAVANELRTVLDHMTTLSGEPEVLHAIAAQAKALAQAMVPHTGNKQLEHFTLDWGDDLNSPLPMSPITGRFNPIAPPVSLHMDGQTLVGEVTLSKVYEGGPNAVHGSWIAAIYDQLLAYAGIFNRTGGPTATLNIEFMRPTPINVPLRFEVTVDSVVDRKIFISGKCFCEEKLVTRCEGLFIQHNYN